MKAEYFEKIMNLLGDVTKSVNVLTIAQKLSEANSDEERVYLSQALSNLLQTDNFQGNPNSFGYGGMNSGFHF